LLRLRSRRGFKTSLTASEELFAIDELAAASFVETPADLGPYRLSGTVEQPRRQDRFFGPASKGCTPPYVPVWVEAMVKR